MAPTPVEDAGTSRPDRPAARRRTGPATLFGRPADVGLRAWLGHPDQVAGVELVEVADGDARGVRLVRLRSGEIEVDLAVDRALDVVRASVRGVPVGWLSPAGLRHPAFAEPVGWGPMRTFTGGLVQTCGLDHVHGPSSEPHRFGHPGITTTDHPMHGRVAALPARLTRLDRERVPDAHAPGGVREVLVVEGEVRQAAPFAEQLVLTRRVEVEVGGRTVRIVDRVRNDGFAPTPLAVLYHVNVGWPVLSPDARIRSTTGAPTATGGDVAGKRRDRVGVPEPAGVEGVWELPAQPGGDGAAHAAVLTDDVGDGRAAGLLVSWEATAMPWMIEWMMPGEGMYVVGLEPSTVGFGGVAAAEAAGSARVLGHGEEALLGVDLTLLHGADDVAAAGELFV